MPLVVGIKFKDSNKIYHFDPQDHRLELGESVVVETIRGLEVGKVAAPIVDMEPSELVADLKPVVRKPTHEDHERIKVYEAQQEEVLSLCAERIAANELPMRLVRADWSFDGSRLTIYFTSQQRVDFRHLVRELARIFRTRIELRQVGARDKAKLLGGIGPCGRPLCCATFLPDFARVSVKMAKDQDLPLNPSKISGVCGRLLCCLSYEQEQYLEIKEELPNRGEHVLTPDGPGVVVAINTIRETVTVDVDANYNDYSLDQLKIHNGRGPALREARRRSDEGRAAPVANDRYTEVPSRSSRDYHTRTTRPPVPKQSEPVQETTNSQANEDSTKPKGPQRRRRRTQNQAQTQEQRKNIKVPEQRTTRRRPPEPDEPLPTNKRRRRKPPEQAAQAAQPAQLAQPTQPVQQPKQPQAKEDSSKQPHDQAAAGKRRRRRKRNNK